MRSSRGASAAVALAVTLAVVASPAGRTAAAQEARTDSSALATPSRTAYWRAMGAGFMTSLLAHEGAHVATSLALGKRPSFGFDKGRPTVYSGIVAQEEPHKQFLFSSMGLNVQAALDELILDVPHAGGSAFERGVLAGGIGTALFYVTIGRTASVSDVDFMARTSSLSKSQISLIYGGVAALHALRISRQGRYANFFMRPGRENGMMVGVRVE